MLLAAGRCCVNGSADRSLPLEAFDDSFSRRARGGGGNAGCSPASSAPVALDKWGRYHVQVTPYMQSTFKNIKWRPKVELIFRVTSPESDDVAILSTIEGGAVGEAAGLQRKDDHPETGRWRRREGATRSSLSAA